MKAIKKAAGGHLTANLNIYKDYCSSSSLEASSIFLNKHGGGNEQ